MGFSLLGGFSLFTITFASFLVQATGLSQMAYVVTTDRIQELLDFYYARGFPRHS